MSAKTFSLLIFLALVFENLDVRVCPRLQRQIKRSSSSGVGHYSSLEPYEVKHRRRVAQILTDKLHLQGIKASPLTKKKKRNDFMPQDYPPPVNQGAFGSFHSYRPETQGNLISVKDYQLIRQHIQYVIKNDFCSCMDQDYLGFLQPNQFCRSALAKFLIVPEAMRGDNCQEAIDAACYAPEGSSEVRRCYFLIQSHPDNTDLVAGNWKSLTECLKDLPA